MKKAAKTRIRELFTLTMAIPPMPALDVVHILRMITEAFEVN
jgi:hypothetical protein